MKKLVMAFVFATLVATPVLAKTNHPRQAATPQAVGSAAQSGYGAYAAAGDATRYGPAVISYGAYAGWDPDPNIRVQLMREHPFVQGNGQ